MCFSDSSTIQTKWLECSKNTVNFDTLPVPLGFVVALGRVFLRGHWYSPVSNILAVLDIHSSATDAA
jgi:hypothetical protein